MNRVLSKPVDSAIFVFFRVFAGVLLAEELAHKLFTFNEYSRPVFHFTYSLFPDVLILPPAGILLQFIVTIMAGVLVAFGLWYRASTFLLFLGYIWIFLMERTQYSHQMYLYCLMSFWLIWMPLGRTEIRQTMPAWMLYLLQFHFLILHFFPALSRVSSVESLQIYLTAHGVNLPAMALAWAMLSTELLVVLLILARKTRMFSVSLCLCFQLVNAFLFGLNTLPWFLMMMSLLFLDPAWPRTLPWFDRLLAPNPMKLVRSFRIPGSLKIFLSAYVLVQLLTPLVSEHFSWNMGIQHKHGFVNFWIQDRASGKYSSIRLEEDLSPGQIAAMVGNPKLILQYAHFIRNKNPGSAVYASSVAGKEGKLPFENIRSDIDLGRQGIKNKSHWVIKGPDMRKLRAWAFYQ